MPHKELEARRVYHRTYKKAHRGKYAATQRYYDAVKHANGRATAHGLDEKITAEEVKALFTHYSTCFFCGSTHRLGMHFRLSFKQGGHNRIENIVISCRSCVGRNTEQWSKDWAQCRKCGRTNRKHLAQGYCIACYSAWRYYTLPNPHVRKPPQLLLPLHFPASTPKKSKVQVCPRCNKPFKARRARLYCPECSYEIRHCSICSTAFRVHCDSKKTTCSRPCRRRFASQRQQGALSHRWQGGKTSQVMLIRTSAAYDQWRQEVFRRDDYTCALCAGRGGKLAAHHIRRFTDRPDLALDVNNGITLCWVCHGAISWKESDYIDQFTAHVAKGGPPDAPLSR